MMKKIDELAKLKDIKPIVEVPDSSLLYTLFLLGLILFFTGIVLYLLKRKPKRKRRKKLTKKELAKQELQNIDFSNTKEAVYTFSKNIPLLSDKEHFNNYKEFIDALENYKYKKEVPLLSQEDIKMMKKIIKEVADV